MRRSQLEIAGSKEHTRGILSKKVGGGSRCGGVRKIDGRKERMERSDVEASAVTITRVRRSGHLQWAGWWWNNELNRDADMQYSNV